MRRTLKWSVIGILGVLLVVFSIVNRQSVVFSLFPFPFEVNIPLFILLYITLFIGVMMGEGIALLHTIKLRKNLKQAQHRIKALESEVLLKTMEKAKNPANIKALAG